MTMYQSIEPIQPVYNRKNVTAIRLTPEHIVGLELAASRRRQKTGNNVCRADMIREAIHVFLQKEGVYDSHLS